MSLFTIETCFVFAAALALAAVLAVAAVLAAGALLGVLADGDPEEHADRTRTTATRRDVILRAPARRVPFMRRLLLQLRSVSR
jgi:hypothetical protein